MLNNQVKIIPFFASGDVTISGLSFINMFDQTNMINLNIKVCRFLVYQDNQPYTNTNVVKT